VALRGKMVRSFDVSPSRLDFGEYRVADGTTLDLDLACMLNKPFEVLGFMEPVRGLELTVLPSDSDLPFERKLRLVVAPDQPQILNLQFVVLNCQVEGEARPRKVAVVVRAAEMSALRIEPEQLTFGTVSAGQEYSIDVVLYSQVDGLPLKASIVGVRSTRKDHITTTVTDSNDRSVAIKLTLGAGCPPGSLTGSLLLKTNLPGAEDAGIPFMGHIK